MRRALLACSSFLPLAAGCGGGGDDIAALPPGSFVAASGSLGPPIHLFGDTLTADVNVVVDRTKLDPDRVSLKTFFAPYEPIEKMEVGRREAGDLAEVRYRLRLRCLERACITSTLGTIQNPGGSAPRTFRFQPAQVQYTDPGAEKPRLLRAVRFGPVESVTRINAQDVTQVYGFPFRGNVTPLPAISQRMSADDARAHPAAARGRVARAACHTAPPLVARTASAAAARARAGADRAGARHRARRVVAGAGERRRTPCSARGARLGARRRGSQTAWATRRASRPGRPLLPRPARAERILTLVKERHGDA